jgi:hypothetical protein
VEEVAVEVAVEAVVSERFDSFLVKTFSASLSIDMFVSYKHNEPNNY